MLDLAQDKAYIFAEARKQFRANEQASEHQTEALVRAAISPLPACQQTDLQWLLMLVCLRSWQQESNAWSTQSTIKIRIQEYIMQVNFISGNTWTALSKMTRRRATEAGIACSLTDVTM